MYSRRDLGKLALGATSAVAFAAQKIGSAIHGIEFGVNSYVFSGLGLPPDTLLDVVIASMVESGLGNCGLFGPLIQPPDILERINAGPGGRGAEIPPDVAAARAKAREELAQWHLTVPLDYFRGIRKKFDNAGIAIPTLSRFPGDTEAELTRTFEVAEVLGAKIIVNALTVTTAKRLAPLADRHNATIGILGGTNPKSTNPDSVAGTGPFEAAVSFSKNYGMAFDIGDSTAGGGNALEFVEDHHDKLVLLYLKDRLKTGEKVPFGRGDAPVNQVLRLLRDRHFAIPCYLDCDYPTKDRPTDVKRSFEYVKAALK